MREIKLGDRVDTYWRSGHYDRTGRVTGKTVHNEYLIEVASGWRWAEIRVPAGQVFPARRRRARKPAVLRGALAGGYIKLRYESRNTPKLTPVERILWLGGSAPPSWEWDSRQTDR
jgi:hypothetical protein